MDLKDMLSGIAVVIDDKIEDDQDENEDLIFKIVEQLERKRKVPFCKVKEMPPEDTWPNLLQAASFILLDWKLWPTAASQLERAGIKKNIEFIEQAKDYFVPVLIFTNEDPEDIKSALPHDVYQEETAGESFVFIQRKGELLPDGELDLSGVEQWMKNNASVYALKTWERVFHDAKKELFSSMYAKSPDWPRVFWKAYRDDGVDPSSSLTHLINDNLRGRMRTDAFEAEILGTAPAEVPREDLQELIGEISFQSAVAANEIRCGDLFKISEKKYWLNIRPDCDCVPRGGQPIGRVELYCIEGELLSDEELNERYRGQLGQFEEQVGDSIAFSIHERKSLRFRFKKLRITRFAKIKDKRIGGLLHPHITRIQQRYALYLQRQGLPRIPEAAVSPAPTAPGTP